jgi:hypothetical protein
MYPHRAHRVPAQHTIRRLCVRCCVYWCALISAWRGRVIVTGALLDVYVWTDTGFSIVQGDDLYAAAVAANGSTVNGYTAQNANERALLMVLSGHADAMWVYGDQAANYHCADGVTQPGWNCELWNRREDAIRPRSVREASGGCAPACCAALRET